MKYSSVRNENLTKAAYIEWQASLFGACGIAIGLGALLARYIQPFMFVLILVGIVLHAWGMYRIHKRNS